MLINWFGQSLQSIAGAMTTSLNEHDLNILALHYCGNLLTTGVIRQLDASESMGDVFKVDSLSRKAFINQPDFLLVLA